jgi:hypothetical protein
MPTARLRSDLGDMCFSEYLLNRFAGQLDSDTEYVMTIDNACVD